MSDIGWGGYGWGTSPWGGLDSGAFALVNLTAIRENVIRLELSSSAYFSGLLDAYDAGDPRKYNVAIEPGGVGLDGTAVRPVKVFAVELPLIPGVPNGRNVDLILDRPMTPWPARYLVAFSNLAQAFDRTVTLSGTGTVDAIYKRIEPPQVDTAQPSRDFANPQTRTAMLDPLPNPNDANQLGCFPIDETGDYATDEGDTSFRKRILRRLVTKKNGFQHLPGYGVGIVEQIKRTLTPGKTSQLEQDAQLQIAQEPDVQKVAVRLIVSKTRPNLGRLVVLARKRGGGDVKLTVPVLIPR